MLQDDLDNDARQAASLKEMLARALLLHVFSFHLVSFYC